MGLISLTKLVYKSGVETSAVNSILTEIENFLGGVTPNASVTLTGNLAANNISGSNTGDQVVPLNQAGSANNFVSAYDAETGAMTLSRPTWENIDKTTSSLADITTKSHTALSDIGTNTHAQIDSALSGLANTSGTNTGDETATTIKTKLGISTLSGSNTGDQDLSSYALTDNIHNVPSGGNENQVLAKNSATNYDLKWMDVSGTSGTVTTVSVATANGVSGSVANATSTPAITLSLGAITPSSVNGLTLSAESSGFTVAGGTTSKTLTVNKTMTLTSPDDTSVATLPAGTKTLLATDGSAASLTNFPTLNQDTTGSSGKLLLSTSINDVSFSGTSYSGTAGENLAFGDLVYYKSDGKWWKADADSADTASFMLGIAGATIAGDASGVIILSGFIRQDSWNWTIGNILFVSATAGGITATAPSTTGQIKRIIGYAVSADIIMFNPSSEYIEIA